MIFSPTRFITLTLGKMTLTQYYSEGMIVPQFWPHKSLFFHSQNHFDSNMTLNYFDSNVTQNHFDSNGTQNITFRYLFENLQEQLNKNLSVECPQFTTLFTTVDVNTFADKFGSVLRKSAAYWRSLNFLEKLSEKMDELVQAKLNQDAKCDELVAVLYCQHCSPHHTVMPCADECSAFANT